MIKLENTDIYGFEAAIRGMRNPLNSWAKSDSYPAVDCKKCGKVEREGSCKKGERDCTGFECFVIGENDLALMRRLAHAGDDHGKFARFINVTVDITAPLYWWKEADTYKVGTVSNSCSTMHKLMDKPFATSDFSFEYVEKNVDSDTIAELINQLNELRDAYLSFDELLEAGKIRSGFSKKDIWYTLIQWLPSSYNQKRTVQLNYQVLNRIYHARKNHKLDEWHVFCDWIESLPYFKEIYLGGEGE